MIKKLIKIFLNGAAYKTAIFNFISHTDKLILVENICGGANSKPPSFCHNFIRNIILADFLNYFTGRMSVKFATKCSLKIPLLLKRFAAP